MRQQSRRNGRTRGPRERSVRYVTLLVCLALLLVALGGRLVWLQLVAGPAYAQAALEQRNREVEIPPQRGSIYDREGEPLAVTMAARTIYAVPPVVVDPDGAATALASILGGDVAYYRAQLTKDSSFAYIARKVDIERAEAVEALAIAGIFTQEDFRRVYPSNELACHVLGFVGVDDIGLEGIEKQYESVLHGTAGKVIAEKGVGGYPIPGGVTLEEPAVNGQNIVLTIDNDIQYEAHVALQAAVKKHGAKSGSVVIMDPDTGAILAAASTPTFDPNAYGTASSAAKRLRPLVDAYEPGSTIKSITAAAVIEKGLFTPQSMFKLPSTLKVGGRTISESHGRPTVTWSLTEIVTNSSNVGAVKLGMALGEDGLYDSFESFGLTEKTGVDFPGEVKGWLPPTSQWSASSIGNIPFGQGISVTALQLLRANAAIANGGELVTPHFLGSFPDDPEQTVTWPKKRVISAETAAQMRQVMKAVVEEGTGADARVEGYAVAGKTGTAQKVRTDGRGYATGKYIGSFLGFLPADDPAVIIVVTIDEPTKGYYGGTVAAPTFARLGAYCMTHLKIPPATAAAGAEESNSEVTGD